MIERAFQAPSLEPVALLVDGENLHFDMAASLMAEAKPFGVPTVRRVYGKAEHLGGWDTLGFRSMMTRPGKNAADLLLCVEAMSLALRDGFRTIVIAASDRDFTHVATHLRELGYRVVGMGEAKAPADLRAAYSTFVELRRETTEAVASSPSATATCTISAAKSMAAPAAAPPKPPSIDKAKSWLVQRLKKPDARTGLQLASLGHELRSALAVSATHYRFASLGHMLRASPEVFDCDPKGAQARVRLAVAAPRGSA